MVGRRAVDWEIKGVGDEVFFAGLPPEAQAEVSQWPSPVMPIADYLALCGRLRDAFPDVAPEGRGDESLGLGGDARRQHDETRGEREKCLAAFPQKRQPAV